MAFAPTGSLFNQQSNRIQEILNKNIEVFLPALDPAWRDTTVSSQGVGSANLIGRDMKVIKTYMGSMAGVLEMADSRSNFVLYGDNTVGNIADKMQTQGLTNTWPDATEGAMARPYQLGIGMKAMVSNLLVTLGEMQAEATPAFIGEILAPKLEGHARLIAHTLCNYWYIADNTNFTLGYSTSVVATAGTAGVNVPVYTILTFSPADLNTDRFAVGMRVDVWNSTTTTRINEVASTRSNAFVTKVDEVKNEVVVQVMNQTITPATYSYTFTYANGKGTGIAGINSWLKGGDASGSTFSVANTLLGADKDSDATKQINVNVHPEFKSYVKGSVGTLTEHKLRQYLRGYHRAKEKYGQYIDCLIASDGVWLNYESQKIGQYMLDRTNRLSSVTNEGSQEGFKFTFDGRTYTGYTSNYIEAGTVYGLRKGGTNWKKYVPPSPKGTQKFDKAEAFIPFEFIAPALGYSTIKVPITKAASGSGNSLLTEGAQMPGMLRMQLVPDQPSGIKLTGVSYDKLYGD
jgi:hypothetical protein